MNASDEFVRVCAQCELEFGSRPIRPDQAKSHGLCRRHAIQMAADYLEDLRRQPQDYFSPDLAESLTKEAA